MCNGCRSHSKGTRWFCRSCNYDLCESCGKLGQLLKPSEWNIISICVNTSAVASCYINGTYMGDIDADDSFAFVRNEKNMLKDDNKNFVYVPVLGDPEDSLACSGRG